ncbi:PKD domain-containing protein [Pedobacter sp. Leaf170]|uniref:PKD domain-containing protein n=1 Tax=Pedobacter sp. Leaf170 TaxID=2876558 RepID=UPI001E2FC956|nr:PKD domain-containing protein [Pedobacter sp. Leaf170]
MKFKSLLGLSMAFFFLVACKKESPEISTTEFSIDKKSLYLTQSIELEAKDATAGSNYIWNYGDGTIETTGSKAKHQYKTSGVFEVTLTVYDKATKIKIRVFPGDISYQIKNNSSFDLDLNSYVNLPVNTVKSILKPNAISDTIYVNLQVTGNLLHVTNISGMAKGKAFRFDDMFWQKDSMHNILSVDNKTKVQLGTRGELGISFILENL